MDGSSSWKRYEGRSCECWCCFTLMTSWWLDAKVNLVGMFQRRMYNKWEWSDGVDVSQLQEGSFLSGQTRHVENIEPEINPERWKTQEASVKKQKKCPCCECLWGTTQACAHRRTQREYALYPCYNIRFQCQQLAR